MKERWRKVEEEGLCVTWGVLALPFLSFIPVFHSSVFSFHSRSWKELLLLNSLTFRSSFVLSLPSLSSLSEETVLAFPVFSSLSSLHLLHPELIDSLNDYTYQINGPSAFIPLSLSLPLSPFPSFSRPFHLLETLTFIHWWTFTHNCIIPFIMRLKKDTELVRERGERMGGKREREWEGELVRRIHSLIMQRLALNVRVELLDASFIRSQFTFLMMMRERKCIHSKTYRKFSSHECDAQLFSTYSFRTA